MSVFPAALCLLINPINQNSAGCLIAESPSHRAEQQWTPDSHLHGPPTSVCVGISLCFASRKHIHNTTLKMTDVPWQPRFAWNRWMAVPRREDIPVEFLPLLSAGMNRREMDKIPALRSRLSAFHPLPELLSENTSKGILCATAGMVTEYTEDR